MTPGLVNAHTHLTLTALRGVVPPMPFAEWLPRLVAAMAPWDIADHEASGVVGAEECLLSGVSVVGDIAYGAAEVASASAAGLGGVYYWELLGLRPEEIDRTLDYLRYPACREDYGRRVVCGLSPHSPYTSRTLDCCKHVHRKAAELGVPTAIHVAESARRESAAYGRYGAAGGHGRTDGARLHSAATPRPWRTSLTSACSRVRPPSTCATCRPTTSRSSRSRCVAL